MTRASRLAFVAVLMALVCPPPSFAAGAEFDDCEANFIAFLGSDAYQFSPLHGGDLGAVRLFSVLSYQRAAATRDFGQAFWRLQVRGGKTRAVVFETQGVARVDDARGLALAEHYWDGRDRAGRMLPSGTYEYTFQARFLPARLKVPARRYEDLAAVAGMAEAQASTDTVILDQELSVERAMELRLTARASSCQVQQNTPLEPGFGYNFYYGSTHAHSNHSDGGQANAGCTSGRYGLGNFSPADVYNYAKNTAGLDFWVINEHNHLIPEAIANLDPPLTEAKVRQAYQDGLAAADAATVADDFVGVYGMEWGVTTNNDQGHITLLETPALLAWDTCTGCNTAPECTPGTNCYFDVFTPKRFGYLTLYQRSVENPSEAGALGIMAHPGTAEFDNYAFDANADDALQGIAVRSGSAFSNTEDCADANVGSSDYSSRWRDALNRGFHLAPVADHDSHCNNYGQGIPTRTVYLLPNGASPALTKAALLQAHKSRHFFATEDPNAQLVFRTADGAHVMGDIFTATGSATLQAALYDPNGDAVQTLELWRGQIGAGALTSPYQTVSGQASLSVTENLSSGTYYYFIHAVQADGHDAWSAPMWITYQPGSCADATAPAVDITAPAAGASLSCVDTTVRVAASDASGIASVQVQVDGGAWANAAYNAGSGAYEYTWASAAASSGGHTLNARATDASCGSNVGSAAPVSVTVDNTGCGGGGGTALDLGGWRLTQANATYNYTIPAGTSIPADGYLVIGRNASKAAFEAFWGVTLGANVVYLSAADGMPVINGSENYTLANASLANEDGPTISTGTSAGESVRRNDPCSAAGSAGSWTVAASSTATPGSGAGAGCGTGVVINEFSDALGTGNYVYEFVELHYDAPAAGDTQAPATSVTAPAGGATVSGSVAVSASATDNVGVTNVEFYLDGALQGADASAPYGWTWNTLAAANGAHTLTSKAYDAAGNVGTSAGVSVTVDNDTTAPATSITSPAGGATVSGTVSVAASATDNVGVTSVEFYLDGALQATDTTSPYSWSWNTTSGTNGAKSLTSKAYDAAGNVGTSAAVSVNVNNVTGTDVSNWRLVQANASLTYFLPAGTAIPNHGYLIIGRNATKAAFEAYWGLTLGSNVVYVNAGDAMPQINGSETYTLYNAAGTKVDGTTVAMGSAGGQSLRRKDPCASANKSNNWTVGSYTTANPGSGAGAGCAKGVVINEFSDPTPTGAYVYEFVELHNDK